MPKGRLKTFLYWCLMVVIILVVTETTGYVVMLKDNVRGINSRGEIDSTYDFLSNSSYFHVRAMLMGDTAAEQLPRYLAQPYLAYIAYPRYAKSGQQEHNEDGYRGKRVPLVHDGKYRILCMGGSTTYGMGVSSFKQTYPAQLDSLLNRTCDSIPGFSARYKGVEVLNAGIEAGTSAEELAQYMFKYHYYKPDLIIIQSGGNDAIINTGDGNYQPDYTNYRRMDFNLSPLPPRSRWLLKSYFCSYVIIRLFFSSITEHPFYKFERDESTAYCKWNHLNIDSMMHAGDYSYLAFYHNFNTLMREIKTDSADVLVLPFVLNPANVMVKENETLRNNVYLFNTMMSSAAEKLNYNFLNLNNDSALFNKYYVDDCHLNATGEQLKAQVISHAVIGLIRNRL